MEPKCHFCGSADIFVGFFSIECPNETCNNYSIKQKEILIEKNIDLESNRLNDYNQENKLYYFYQLESKKTDWHLGFINEYFIIYNL